MIIGDIASVPSTKNTSGKIVSKISNSWELNVPYLATLCLLELCPRGNNKDVIIIILVHDNVYIPC
jgi:hypothetical protein